MAEVTTSEAVRAYAVHPNVLNRLILMGRLEARKNSDGHWLISQKSLERWNRDGRPPAGPRSPESSVIQWGHRCRGHLGRHPRDKNEAGPVECRQALTCSKLRRGWCRGQFDLRCGRCRRSRPVGRMHVHLHGLHGPTCSTSRWFGGSGAPSGLSGSSSPALQLALKLSRQPASRRSYFS